MENLSPFSRETLYSRSCCAGRRDGKGGYNVRFCLFLRKKTAVMKENAKKIRKKRKKYFIALDLKAII